MRRYVILIGLLPLLISCSGFSESGVSSDVWKKEVNVFGITIQATDCVSDAKVRHAANVLAEYLDNDNDGVIDNPAVVDQIKENNGWLGMSCEADDVSAAATELFAEETHPGGSSLNSGFDATLEEILHVITEKGYANAYPSVFAEREGSSIANAMDTARGGVKGGGKPVDSYPADAWYTYDDKTCDYSCMVTEYFYWGLSSILDAQSYSGRLDEIGGEWDLNTKAKVKATDPTLYNLLTNPQYRLPATIPDGTYTGTTLTITRK